jgi:hypothetical protein
MLKKTIRSTKLFHEGEVLHSIDEEGRTFAYTKPRLFMNEWRMENGVIHACIEYENESEIVTCEPHPPKEAS